MLLRVHVLVLFWTGVRGQLVRTANGPQVVQTANGPILGKVSQDGERFEWLGIPYAKPPLGRLRFVAPVEMGNWRGTLNATELPNTCYQNPDYSFGEDFGGTEVWNPNTNISEDCLYLNVYAPAKTTTTNRPVVVWIFGGGFSTGSAHLDIYNPRQFVKRDIVFVAMQYRVGPQGFMYLGREAPGNAGLKDQVMALEWVQANIASFGGDPSRVTIMGESAGAASVAFHMVSPRSSGLFSAAILQSSGLTPRWGLMSRLDGLERTLKLAELVGCDPKCPNAKIMSCLRKVDPQALVDNMYNVEDYTVNFFPFVAMQDEDFLPEDPLDIVEKGEPIQDVPVLIGSNANEGFWSLMYFMWDIYKLEELPMAARNLNDTVFREKVRTLFPYLSKDVSDLISYNYQENIGTDDLDSNFNIMDQMVGDSDFVCNTEEFARIMAERGNKVFRYFYDHRSSTDLWPSWSGSKHGDELEFVFGLPLNDPSKYTNEEVTLAEGMVNFWTEFIKKGDLQSWPTYSSPNRRYMHLNADGNQVLDDEKFAMCRLWNEVIRRIQNN